MAVKATTHIHLNFSGDITADFIYTLENSLAAGITHTQTIQGGNWYPIFNPLPITGVVLSGLMVIPPLDNTHRYNLVTADFAGGIVQSDVVFHASKPSLFSIREILSPLRISHDGGVGVFVTFRFVWF